LSGVRSKGRPDRGRAALVSSRGREVQVARRTALLAAAGVQRVVVARAIARPALAAESSASPSRSRQSEFGFER
jgi:hypothetical protein